MTRVKIAEIDIKGCQSRVATDGDTVKEYVELAAQGVKFPPVDLYYDGAKYWCADGIHRILAAKRAGQGDIAANVHKGTKEDALWHAAGANKTHGLHRSNEDKKRAVKMALELRPDASDPVIAEHCGVHVNTVAKYRKVTPTNCGGCEDGQSTVVTPKGSGTSNNGTKPIRRVGRDGIARTVAPAPEPEPEGFDLDAADKPYASLIKRYGDLYSDLTAFKDSPEGAYIRNNWLAIDRGHKQAADNIKSCRPKEVCPKCKGEKCRFCAHTGYLTLAGKRNKAK